MRKLIQVSYRYQLGGPGMTYYETKEKYNGLNKFRLKTKNALLTEIGYEINLKSQTH